MLIHSLIKDFNSLITWIILNSSAVTNQTPNKIQITSAIKEKRHDND